MKALIIFTLLMFVSAHAKTEQVGIAKITAVYVGDKTLGGSTSNPVKQVVK